MWQPWALGYSIFRQTKWSGHVHYTIFGDGWTRGVQFEGVTYFHPCPDPEIASSKVRSSPPRGSEVKRPAPKPLVFSFHDPPWFKSQLVVALTSRGQTMSNLNHHLRISFCFANWLNPRAHGSWLWQTMACLWRSKPSPRGWFNGTWMIPETVRKSLTYPPAIGKSSIDRWFAS